MGVKEAFLSLVGDIPLGRGKHSDEHKGCHLQKAGKIST